MSTVLRLALGAAVLVLVANVAIVGVSALIGWRSPAPAPTLAGPVPGVRNLAVVDARLWRGSAPDLTGYQVLADAGVRTVIDLRAEHGAGDLDPHIRALGLRVVHVPIRDGQAPGTAAVDAVVAAIDASDGLVYLHCGAGVGRTGSVAAAYLVRTGEADARQAVARNLAIGPPSVEQIWFAAGIGADGEVHRPPAAVVAVSRVLDAPRRLWSSLRG